MDEEKNSISVNIGNVLGGEEHTVIVDFGITPIIENPQFVDIICFFKHPISDENYRISQRENKREMESNSEIIMNKIRETVIQFFSMTASY